MQKVSINAEKTWFSLGSFNFNTDICDVINNILKV